MFPCMIGWAYEVAASPYKSIRHGDATLCAEAYFRIWASDSELLATLKSYSRSIMVDKVIFEQGDTSLVSFGRFVLEGVCDPATVLLLAGKEFRVSRYARVDRRYIRSVRSKIVLAIVGMITAWHAVLISSQ